MMDAITQRIAPLVQVSAALLAILRMSYFTTLKVVRLIITPINCPKNFVLDIRGRNVDLDMLNQFAIGQIRAQQYQ
jgi:hypothetical protein